MLLEDSCTYLFSNFVLSFDLSVSPAAANQAFQQHKLAMRLNWDSLLGLFGKCPESGHLNCVVGVNDEAAVTKDETDRDTRCASHRDVESLIVSLCQ